MIFFEIVTEYAGYILTGMMALMILLFIMLIISMTQNKRLRIKYQKFMQGKDAKSLEETIIKELAEVKRLTESDKENKKNIDRIFHNLNETYQKMGMVKYDAFHEMGGKLSFSIAMLDKENDGFVLNAVHSRDGCYTYVKEIVKGKSVILLAQEEKEALDIAMGIQKEA